VVIDFRAQTREIHVPHGAFEIKKYRVEHHFLSLIGKAAHI
jgi:hypothetical protein